MRVIDPGHVYSLRDNKSKDESCQLTFYKDKEINGDGLCGTTNQEVLRALIARVKFLDAQVPHKFNQEVIYNLRRALVLHEMRHVERLLEKGEAVEDIPIGDNGHWV